MLAQKSRARGYPVVEGPVVLLIYLQKNHREYVDVEFAQVAVVADPWGQSETPNHSLLEYHQMYFHAQTNIPHSPNKSWAVSAAAAATNTDSVENIPLDVVVDSTSTIPPGAADPDGPVTGKPASVKVHLQPARWHIACEVVGHPVHHSEDS